MTVRVRVAAVALLIITAVTGCTTISTQKDPTMDYPTARSELDGLLTGVQAMIGGVWDPFDAGAGPCVLPSGNEGAQAPLARIGPGVPADQQEALAQRVTQLWTDAGFPPVRGEEPITKDISAITLRYPGGGTYGVDGLYLTLEFSERSSSIDGQTRCVPGDADTVPEPTRDPPFSGPAPNITFPPPTPFPPTPTPTPASTP